MSGEKTGKIEISDRTTLLEAWLAALVASRKRKEREGAQRRERNASREREEREEAQRARERKALKRAGDRLAELEGEFASIRARAQEMRSTMAGIELPPEPEFPEIDRHDTGAILENLSEIESTIAGYRSRLNESMLGYSRARAAAEGRDEALDWYESFAARTPPAAAIGFSNNEALAGRQARANELRHGAFERARKLMQAVERRVVHVSENLRKALAEMLNASSLPEMRVAEARLKQEVDAELRHVAEKEAHRRKELERLQTDRVAALMAESLVEMGYVVSNVYEAAYAQNGQIIACRRDPPQTEHAVRLTIDRETRQVTSNLVRIADSDAPREPTDEQKARDEKADKDAEGMWCDRDGIVRFERELADRGVTVKFGQRGTPGIEVVSAADVAAASPTLEEHLRAGDRRAAVRRQPKARSRQAR